MENMSLSETFENSPQKNGVEVFTGGLVIMARFGQINYKLLPPAPHTAALFPNAPRLHKTPWRVIKMVTSFGTHADVRCFNALLIPSRHLILLCETIV